MLIVRRQAATLVCIFLAAAWLASCAQPYHDPGEKYVFIASDFKEPYWQEARAGFMDAAKTLDVKVEVAGPDTLAANDELTILQNAVMMHPTGILLTAADPELFKSEIDNAIAQEIPVICIDVDVPDSRRLAFIGTDNFHVGNDLAKKTAEILKGHGSIVVVGAQGRADIDERVRGVTESLKKFPGIGVIATLDDKGDSRTASDGIVAVLQSKKKVDGIVALEKSGNNGAVDALHRLNQDGQIPIIVFGKEIQTLQRIINGTITASVGEKPYIMTYYGLKFLDDLHHHVVHELSNLRIAPYPPMPTWVDAGTVVVDKNNAPVILGGVASHQKPK